MKKSSFFRPKADAYARSAVRTIGIVKHTTGYFAHQIKVNSHLKSTLCRDCIYIQIPSNFFDLFTNKRSFACMHLLQVLSRTLWINQRKKEKPKTSVVSYAQRSNFNYFNFRWNAWNGYRNSSLMQRFTNEWCFSTKLWWQERCVKLL